MSVVANKLTGVDLLRSVIRASPLLPGVYEMCGEGDEVLYVGKAKSLKKRLISYTRTHDLPVRLQRMVHSLRNIRLTTTHTENEALLLEYSLIQKYKPPCNVLLKNGQKFVTIGLSKHKFPQLTRQRGRRANSHLFGPYLSAAMADEMLRTIQKAFKLRTCSDHEFQNRIRPCLNYDMGLCSGPCVRKIEEPDYVQSVKEATMFLKGKSFDLQKQLINNMEQASEQLEFEKACIIRDRLAALASVQSRQNVVVESVDEADVIAIYSNQVRVLSYRNHHLVSSYTHVLDHAMDDVSINLSAFIKIFYMKTEAPPLILVNEMPSYIEDIKSWLSDTRIEQPKRGDRYELVRYALQGLEKTKAHNALKMLTELQKTIGLEKDIKRLEIYDNSHLQGTHTIGYMVVVTPDKGVDGQSCRRFNLPAGIHDDNQLMQHLLMKRFQGTSPHPDLMIVDGGLTQIRSAESVLAALGLNINVLGFVKHKTRKDGLERLLRSDGVVIDIDTEAELFQSLIVWRDAAHRGAIQSHRSKRAKGMMRSTLEDLEGVGRARKKILLQKFGSTQGIAAAGVDDLCNTPGINRALAERIYTFFH